MQTQFRRRRSPLFADRIVKPVTEHGFLLKTHRSFFCVCCWGVPCLSFFWSHLIYIDLHIGKNRKRRALFVFYRIKRVDRADFIYKREKSKVNFVDQHLHIIITKFVPSIIQMTQPVYIILSMMNTIIWNLVHRSKILFCEVKCNNNGARSQNFKEKYIGSAALYFTGLGH